MSEPLPKRRLRLPVLARWLLLLGGVGCVVAGVIGFFAIVSIRSAAGSSGSRSDAELLLGRLTLSRYSMSDAPEGTPGEKGWEFDVEPNNLPRQLKSQEMGKAFKPWSAEPSGLVYSFDYVPESPMKGGGIVIRLIPIGSLCLTVGLVWTYWERRKRRLAAET